MTLGWPLRRAPVVTLRRRHPSLRRLLSAGLLAGAAAVALPALAPAPPRTVPVVVAAHALEAGHRIGPGDLSVARWAPATGPESTARDPTRFAGRVIAGPVEAGGPVTEADLLGPGLLAGAAPGLLAAPVRLSDPAAAGLVRAGDRVDLIAAATGSAVETGVVVLADPGSGAAGDAGASAGVSAGVGADELAGSDGSSGGAALGSAGSWTGNGAVLVVAVTPDAAGRLARAQASGPLSVAVHRR